MSYEMKYVSQLDKETAENTDLMESIKGFDTVSALAKGYHETASKMKGMVKIPTAESSEEERNAYFERIGVPKIGDSYDLSDGDFKPEEIKAVKAEFEKQLGRNAITKKQGQELWNFIAGTIKADRDETIKKNDEYIKSFDKRLEEMLKKDFPVDDDRKKTINEDTDLFTEFLNDTKLGDKLKNNVLRYDPEFVHAIAQYHKTQRAGFVGGSGSSNTKSNELFKDLTPSTKRILGIE